MSAPLIIDPHTAAAQAAASNPASSAWVSANAGAGKTFVLARRVVRLLLAGVDPQRILCLTFTRAAAAEMAKRVFGELGRWTTMADAELRDVLAGLLERPPGRDDLAKARRLFASALDTPGGLKIQTIHAFCERLLHQFPFEANVAGHFEVLDERAERALTEEARRAVLARAAADPQGALGTALEAVLVAASDFIHDASISEFVARRDALKTWIDREGSLEAAIAVLRPRLGLADGETSRGLLAEVVEGAALSQEAARALIARLRRGGVRDQEAADRLMAYAEAEDIALAAIGYLDYFQKDNGEFYTLPYLATKQVLAGDDALSDLLVGEVARLEPLVDRIRTAELHESSAAMLRLAVATIDEYERRKQRRGRLDFEDLVVRTVALLSHSAAARWVQYKLDRGIDHLLVDEAQDTSPRQWQVVRALTGDFFAGEGASDAIRTVFAVGDEKQSIFSFQGAVPAWFGKVRGEMSATARAAAYPWADTELHLSFRSVPAVLAAVDAVFAAKAHRSGLSADPAAAVEHMAQRRTDPGRVILWPVIRQPDKPAAEDWATPVDHLGEQSPEVQLADRIAATIGGWLRRGAALDAPDRDGNPRPIRPGNILILVRSRGALTDAINRALKSAGVAIAGADRLTLTDHIAVLDLIALARVVLTPEDDLSLAALLKSPLIGLDEEVLYTLAHDRGRATLWQRVEALAASDAAVAAAHARIAAWRSDADRRDPHAFFAHILAAPYGRRAFLARLGPEVEDVLDEFLAATLAYEAAETPSLEGFLDWLQASETEIKRDTDTLRDEVRVMTVHGAKGLEADIVFLVDNGMNPWVAAHDPRALPLDDRDDPDAPGPLVWNRSVKAMPRAIKAAIDAWRSRSEEEYRRLLYVGMTRARDRLYVVGIDKRTPKEDRRWHAMVRRALEAQCLPAAPDDGEGALEWRPGGARAGAAEPRTGAAGLALPAWLDAPAPAAARRLRLRLTPSTALSGGEQTPARSAFVPWRAARAARVRGALVHRLLQSLPAIAPAERAAVAARYLEAAAGAFDAGERQEILASVMAVLADTAFAEVFAPTSRAEVEIAGRIETARGTAEVSGRIDRLAVTDRRVLVVDYKTNNPPPATFSDVPEAYVGQLALYRMVLAELYPDRKVAAALLWTATPALTEIPEAALDRAAAAIVAGGDAVDP